MGIWGVKLYDNDCAADIKDLFLDLTDAGLSPVEAAEQIEAEFPEMFQDSEDGPMAQVILADLLWKRGCLEDERKGKALAWLESGGDLARWKHEAPQRAAARQRNLEKLYQQLLSPMPDPRQPKAVPQQRRKQLQWKPHEVYALPLHSEESAKLGLHGEYALIYIQGPSSVYDGYHNPRVWLKITKNCYLPKNSEEFNQLDFQRIACTPYANRFSPFSREDELPLDFRQTYQADEWGMLPEFTMELIQATGHHPPNTLQLLGVFENAQPPTYEYFRYQSALGCSWKFAEEYILQCYRAHTLHLSPYYDKKQ